MKYIGLSYTLTHRSGRFSSVDHAGVRVGRLARWWVDCCTTIRHDLCDHQEAFFFRLVAVLIGCVVFFYAFEAPTVNATLAYLLALQQ